MTPILLAPPGNGKTARALATRLGASVGDVSLHGFPDGESLVRIDSDVTGRTVVVVATLDRPDPKLVPLMFLAQTARELGARQIGLVAPYLPYLRQDHRFRPGQAISSVCLGRLLSREFDWLVTVDPHLHRHHALDEILSIPSVAVAAAPAMAAWVRAEIPKPVLVGPDSESHQWVADVARRIDAPFLVLEKRRFGDRNVEVSTPKANRLRHHTPVIIDDVAATAHTLMAAVRSLVATGATDPVCMVVHGLFVDDADRVLLREGAQRVLSCNTVAHRTNAIDIGEGLASAVRTLLAG